MVKETCEECGGFRMGENMMHNDWCSQCTTGTTAEKFINNNMNKNNKKRW